MFVVTVPTPRPKDTALSLLLGCHFGRNTMRNRTGMGHLRSENSNPLQILLQEFRQVDLNASEQGFVHALWHATNEEERMVLDRALENMVSQQLLEEESATVVLPHVALVYNDPSIRLDAIANLLYSPSCSYSHQARKSLMGMFLHRWSEDDNILKSPRCWDERFINLL